MTRTKIPSKSVLLCLLACSLTQLELNRRRATPLLVQLIRQSMRWSRLSGQIFRVDKWSVCRG